jgi:alpha-glucosidase
MQQPEDWWPNAVIYHAYVRSFQDSDGDGVGDLGGVLNRLDHLAWLGVSGLWLSPITASPNADWGYDVSDYTAVQPDFGDLAAVDELISEAGRRGIRILLDLVPNHTSDRHPWFRDPERRDWYIWSDRPNNWLSAFGGPAWTYRPDVGRYYLHSFLPEQPDLNWRNAAVRAEFERIIRFWLDRGVAGFRIDVAHGAFKDARLRDNPAPALDTDPVHWRRRGQRLIYNQNQPEVHELLRSWRRLADSYQPSRLLLGETYIFDLAQLAGYYGRNDELQLALNFPFFFEPFEEDALNRVVQTTREALPEGACAVWAASNHDAPRFPSRWCDGDPSLIRCALTLLLSLPGTAILYYGDEIGMTDVAIGPQQVRDCLRTMPRDPARTPMQWEPGPNAGFTTPGVAPWLPIGDMAACNVADQARDPGSILHLCRDLVRLRDGRPRRLLLNLTDEERRLEARGRVAICTDRSRDGERLAGELILAPRHAALLEP